MIWPFSHFGKPRASLRFTIDVIYGMIVAQAREPLFYRDLNVPDTVNGRFDLLLLHLWMLLRRLKAAPAGGDLRQGLFDRFCNDMDANLRELGVSDLKVPKRMQAFGEAFYGRSAAYDAALAEGPEPLARALSKNIFNGLQIERARDLGRYVRQTNEMLDRLDDAALRGGSWQFPSPSRAGVPV